ncbi:NACHT domain-containing protein [Streptomyces monticola]|uniref:NACHT domain-containing protein n=1 Tax=Streptomyces monticola TaxID=2666263 RepID=A0ABW2JFJ0_9ACTN
MDPAAIGTRLASSAVAPLIKKLFVADGPGAGLVDRPVRVSRLVSFMGEKRTFTERDMRKLTTELIKRALKEAGPYDPPLPDDEQQLVAETLMHTLHVLGELEMDDVQAVRLGPAGLAWLLRKEARRPLFLSADALHFHNALLEVACLHILNFFTQRSTFVARTLVTQSQQLSDLVARVDLLIERTPAQSAEDAGFEWRYARHIEHKHGLLTIYGIDLNQSREWPLGAAYLSLETTRTERPATGTGLPDGGGGDSHAQGVWQVHSQPIERALAAHDRLLLRGVAGSGKTTLVQWLAVTAARQDTGDGRHYLLGRVPFVLPLRTLIRNTGPGAVLPTPDRFLAAVGCPLAGMQPGGWAERVLSAGRALVLVDGIDEVPAQERERTRRWLHELLGVFPGNLWLVTSRPSAVREDWLDAEGFTELALSPMSRSDVAQFISRWHTAAGADASLERALLTAIRTKQELARLATNPLMCGLICALHRERRGYLPHGRKDLYDAALWMLLERRDRERDLPSAPDGIQLTREPQIQLLQKLAYWMIRNGRSEMSEGVAVALIDDALAAMPYVAEQGTAQEICRHLLLRSGLLREPGPAALDFIHRTFQDYLGAKAAVEERDFGLLVNNAHLDQWEDVIRMAVAHARKDERADLLTALLDRGDRRGALLSAACLEDATELDPAVRARVKEHTAALLPPQDHQVMGDLIEVGPIVLGLLPGPDELTAEEARRVVQTASLIGTDAAIPVLARFRDHPDVDVRQQLVWAWHRLDTAVFAEEVIAHLDETGVYYTVTNRRELDTLRALGGRARIQVSASFTPEELTAGLITERVTHLWLEHEPEYGVEWLGTLPNLVRVTVERTLLTGPQEIRQAVPEHVEVVRTR